MKKLRWKKSIVLFVVSRLKEIDETRNYFIEEVKQNELMTKKNKKILNFT